MSRYRFVVLLLLTLILFVGCSTKKNNFFSRTYHNVSAHYNTWWNGNESIKDGVRDLELSAKDNFTRILPVYKLGTKTEAASINSKADRAIEKASIAIQRHSMLIRKREYCRWIDDSYLMIGKAYFYKQDYYAAARTFDYTSSRYRGTAQATEALVWLIRANTQLKRYTKAQNTIDEVKELIRRGAVSKRVTRDYNVAVADFYLQQEDYKSALPYLENALWSGGTRTEKARIAFVMGQVYQKEKNVAKAVEYFKISAKKGNYDFAINSKLNIAKCYDPRFQNSNKINRYLTRMVKEDKNVEYRDQIYFALSEIARIDKEYDKMAGYLRKSVATSKGNDYQKFESSLRLADYLFTKTDYVDSRNYYDTASQFLPKEYANYNELSKKLGMLINLGSQFVVIKDEDSLQRVARMPEAERNKMIDDIIAKIKKEQEEEKEKEERDRRLAEMGGLAEAQRPGGGVGGPGMPGMGNTRAWYFYNQTLVTAGINDFNRRWGNRKLEDLWRLKNKQAVSFDSEMTEDVVAAEQAKADSIAKSKDNPLSRTMYLDNLPLTPEKMAESNERIKEAYYAAANIFLDDLKDFKGAEKTFDSLCIRFSDTATNRHIPYAYYQIYKLNKEKLNNVPKSDLFKGYIIEMFPDTDYAKLLMDPEYYIMLSERKNFVANLYKSAYEAYKKKNYFTVYGNTMIAEKDYADDPLMPKFKYLQALSMLKTEPVDSTAKVLQTIIAKYPQSSVKPSAESLLKSLMRFNPDSFEEYELAITDSTKNESEMVKAKYVKDKKGGEKYNYVLLLDGSKMDVDALKIRIADHNATYRKLEKMSITAVLAYDNYYMVVVGTFDNDGSAMDYLSLIEQDDYVFSTRLKDANPRSFIISRKHFQEMFKNKDYEDYYKYFNKEYLNK